MRLKHPRSGFTLVETLLAVVIAGILFAAVYRTVIMQQRSYRQQTALVASRQVTRTSLDLLAVELRDVSATGGDLLLATTDSLSFRAFRKMGVVCNVNEGASLLVWELGEPFARDDQLLVFQDDDTLAMNDDRWISGAITDDVAAIDPAAGSTCAQWSEFPVTQLPAAAVAVSEVRVGAPVRAFEPLTYGLYRVDGEWVLGRHGVGEEVVALVGPLASRNEHGLYLRYYDGTGTAFTPSDATQRERVERVDIFVQGIGIGADGEAVVDSLVTQVHLRGNAWN